MKQTIKNTEFDVVIIGAGISGLVCGCYIASSGRKVLIAEKNANVGGCCCSFKKANNFFDAFAHSVGGLRKGGAFSSVFEDLRIKDRLAIEKRVPSDIVYSPDHTIILSSDFQETQRNLQKEFPNEVMGIRNFFNYLGKSYLKSNIDLLHLNFWEFLNLFFVDTQLKSLLSMPVFGNAGLPPSKISAFSAVKLYQEFLLDGGYYPVGGMQEISDLLSQRFRELGGTLILSNGVKKIILNNQVAVGVVLKDETVFTARFIVSNCDAKQTYFKLLGVANNEIEKMRESLSLFIIYITTKKTVESISRELKSTVWIMKHYDLERMFLDTTNGNFVDDPPFLVLHGAPDDKGFVISVLAPFMNEDFWREKKENLCNNMLKSFNHKFNKLNQEIDTRIITTPITIYNWTGNSCGAAYGWESSPDQTLKSKLINGNAIKNLYLTGHWTTQSFGVSGVAIVGKSIAMKIIRKLN